MKTFKMCMNGLALVEKVILCVAMLFILVLTFGNVFSRYVVHQSWSFTEELVISVFVLISLMAAALAAREGSLVSLPLLTDALPKSTRKPLLIFMTIVCVFFSVILFRYGIAKVITQMGNGKRTPVLSWPEWWFYIYIPISAVCMILHFIEHCLDVCLQKEEEK